MEISNALIDNLANLARLQFSEAEKVVLQSDLQKMIAFVEKLQEVDTKGIEPLLHMTEAMNVYRADACGGSMEKAAALANAGGSNKDYFTVPKVIKK